MKYKISTLGCKVNQVETQALESMLQEKGFIHAQEGDAAELVIVNTCAVTAESGRKSRQAIRRMMQENPGAVSAICGCFSQLSPEETQALGADVVHGSGDKNRFVQDVIKAMEAKQRSLWADNPFSRRQFEELSGGAVDGRTRAMLKIQDGCVNFCTYCIIPYTRGAVRSLPVERCAAQAARLASQGFRELVVTGIEIASYGKDLEGKPGLIDAIEAIAQAAGDMRIRLGSLEPTVITENFCRRLSEIDGGADSFKGTTKICNHFHLSLQSGCDKTLLAMNRKYTTAQFYDVVCRLRRYFPDCGLTSDLIVGFPEETKQDFEATVRFIEKCAFSSMHIFPYSVRPGTKAAQMQGQLTHAEKAERASIAQNLADKMEKIYLKSCVGKILPVLFETEKDGMCVGHAPNYAQVCANGGQMHGLVGNVKITGCLDKMLVGITI